MVELKKPPYFWTERIGNEIFLFHNGEIVYKRWLKPGTTEKRQPSFLFQSKGWRGEYIIPINPTKKPS
jgi:hypothetical protein